jgi:hypothetical protein
VVCAVCRRECVSLGYKIPAPRRSRPDEWQRLQSLIALWRRQRVAERARRRVRRTHDLEQEIARLEAMPSNPGRKSRIKRLKRCLSAVSSGHPWF